MEHNNKQLAFYKKNINNHFKLLWFFLNQFFTNGEVVTIVSLYKQLFCSLY